MYYDCLIVGAGQAGLACARVAQDLDLRYVVLEQGVQAGEAWRQREPELKLFTPRVFSSLSGLEFELPKNALPTSSEMAKYFSDFQRKFDINCLFNTRVTATKHRKDGMWIVTCSNGQEFISRSLVLANGSNQQPVVPTELAAGLASEVVQTDAEGYWQNMPQQGSNCLVVGDGASGRQIARDLAMDTFDVTLSSTGRNMVPNHFLNRNIFHWLDMVGLLRADRDTWLAKLLKKRNPVPRQEDLNDKALKKAGVKIVGRVKNTSHTGVFFDDEQYVKFSYIIWCVGYKEVTDFLPLDIPPSEEWIISERGVLPLPGVFVVGRRWLHNRASELIMGTEHDAKYTMSHLRQWLDQTPLAS